MRAKIRGVAPLAGWTRSGGRALIAMLALHLILTITAPEAQAVGLEGAPLTVGPAVETARLSRLAVSGNIGDRFNRTRRNDGDTMAGHLKMYKDGAVVYGTIIEEAPHVNFPASVPPDYYNFMCAPWWDPRNPPYLWGRNLTRPEIDAILLARGDPPDGDLTFKIRIDERKLAPDFWTMGFVFAGGNNTAGQIQAKLADGGDEMEVELIMYGKPADCDHAGNPGESLLPGWADTQWSVLLDGRPINGQIALGSPAGLGTTQVPAILGQPLSVGTLVRITGFLALDCHAEFWDLNWTGDCEEEEADVHNVEIHPAYAIDIGVDPCRSEADRLSQLESALNALIAQLHIPREAAERVNPDVLERRLERAQAQINAWHAQHDAELGQLQSRLASAACRIQWQTEPRSTPR